MTQWTPERIREAAAAWVWVPEDAEQVLTDDYQLIGYPEFFTLPTQVAWSRSERPAGDLVDEVSDHVRSWGRPKVSWWVSEATRPADTEAILLDRGAELVETVEVLAYDMTDAAPAIPVPPGVTTEVVQDQRSVRAELAVWEEVWSEPHPTDDDAVTKRVEDAQRELAGRTGFQVVALVDDMPASAGGCTLADGAARLWGAGTRPAFRGRGAYRAVLARRLELARDWGATLALVKGRVETSGPILRRVGFNAYGEERCYSVNV